MSTWVLMNKNVPVCSIKYNEHFRMMEEIVELHNPEYSPLSIIREYAEVIDIRNLQRWWKNRAIPASRRHIRDSLELIGMGSIELLEKNRGLSLSDQYWMNDLDSPREWSEVNFFNNDFSDDVGRALFAKGSSSKDLYIEKVLEGHDFDLRTPDASAGGVQRKRWKIIDGKRWLLKTGTEALNQETYNELAATALFERLFSAEDFVPYYLVQSDGQEASACECMIDEDHELVSAAELFFHFVDEDVNYPGYLNILAELGITDAEQKLAKMFVGDYIIANRDRHFNNFGLIRNVNTLEFTGVAPIFDSGTSLYAGVLDITNMSELAYTDKPFASVPDSKLKLASDMSWYDPVFLEGYIEELSKILSMSKVLAELPQRLEFILDMTRQRINIVQAVIERKDYRPDPISMEWFKDTNRPVFQTGIFHFVE